MGSYVSSQLTDGEEIVKMTSRHWVAYSGAVLFFAMGLVLIWVSESAEVSALGFGVIGFGAIMALNAWIGITTSEFAVTNRRVLLKTGLIRRHTVETMLQKVEGVSVSQDIPGRLLGYGTIQVTGTGGTSESFNLITDPTEFRRAVQEQVQARTHPPVIPPQATGPSRDERECPWCAETILAKARICRFCNRDVETAS